MRCRPRRTRRAPAVQRTSASQSPLIARDVEVSAQRAPDVARVDAVLDGPGGGPPAELRKYVVDEQRRTAHRPELAFDKFLEFGQTHAPKLRRRRERFMAHPYRIIDLGDAGPGPASRLLIPRR